MANSYNKKYSLPTEITTEIRLYKNITARSIVIIMIFLYLGIQIMDKIYMPLQIPFMIFHMIVGALLCVNSNKNKKKRLYQSALLMLFRERNYYKPIPEKKKLPDTIKKYNNYSGGITYVEPNDEE